MSGTENKDYPFRVDSAIISNVAAIEYDLAFGGSGIEISPRTMPLAAKVYTFPELSRQTFHGRADLLADSRLTHSGTPFDAAHIIPWAESHDDHPNNGMALCKIMSLEVSQLVGMSLRD